VEVVDGEDPDVHRPGCPGRLIGECDEEEDDADEDDGADDGLLPGRSAGEEGDGRHLNQCCGGGINRGWVREETLWFKQLRYARGGSIIKLLAYINRFSRTYS